jgi:hypothetical protein
MENMSPTSRTPHEHGNWLAVAALLVMFVLLLPVIDGVNAEVREAIERDGYSLFRIGLSVAEIPRS